MKPLRAKSFYIPDTTLHPLNGAFVVDIGDAVATLTAKTPMNAPWLSPDEAEAFAASLVEAAALARDYRETEAAE